MYVRRSSLTGLEAFLDGYDQHALRHGGSGLTGWKGWLEARIGHRSNLVWQGLVRIIALPDDSDRWNLTPEQEARVISVLFALLDDFLAEREANMTGHRPGEPDDQTLLAFLDAQRDAVLAVVDGLKEEAWHRPVVPSGWTPAGLVEHLGGAERHWFQGVVADAETYLPWDEGLPPYDPQAAFVCDRPPAEIISYYRDQCARSNAVLSATPLSATPRGTHGDPEMSEPPTCFRRFGRRIRSVGPLHASWPGMAVLMAGVKTCSGPGARGGGRQATLPR